MTLILSGIESLHQTRGETVLAVVGRDAGPFLAVPGVLALLGAGGIAAGVWLRKRVPAEWRRPR